MQSSLESRIENHYRQPGLLDQLQQRLDEIEATGERLTVEALAGADEFHTGGARATDFALNLLPLTGDERVLDAGCGIGGTARRLAAQFGCRVTGIDLTPDFIQAATNLTERIRLAGSCEFQTGSVLKMPFVDKAFGATVCFHVAMNIEARREFYREVRRVTQPGGWFLTYDVVRGPNPEGLAFPLPWSDSPDGSFLLTAAETQSTLAEVGFVDIQQHQLPDLTPEQRQQLPSGPPNILLGEQAAQKVANHKAAFSDQRISTAFFLARL